MNKPALFLDFDNFKFDTWPAHIAYLNEKYGINSVIADYAHNPPLEQVVGRYLPEGQRPTHIPLYEDLGKNFLASIERHADVKPMEGMCEVVPKLAEKYDLWTVTARQKTSRPVIEHLIERYIPGCIAGIHNVWEHHGDGRVTGVSKRDFIWSFQGPKVAFLDDSPGEILQLQDLLPCYLYDPKGIHDGDGRIQHRVRSWWEIGEVFL